MKYSSAQQRHKNSASRARDAEPERDTNLAANAAVETLLTGMMAVQCRVRDYRNRKNKDGDKKIEHLHRFL